MPAVMYRRNPNVEESPLRGDLMLFDPDRNQFFVLNRTMAHVWHCCDDSQTLPQIVLSLERSFADVDPSIVESDATAALGQLIALGLVSQSDVPTHASRQEAVT